MSGNVDNARKTRAQKAADVAEAWSACSLSPTSTKKTWMQCHVFFVCNLNIVQKNKKRSTYFFFFIFLKEAKQNMDAVIVAISDVRTTDKGLEICVQWSDTMEPAEQLGTAGARLVQAVKNGREEPRDVSFVTGSWRARVPHDREFVWDRLVTARHTGHGWSVHVVWRKTWEPVALLATVYADARAAKKDSTVRNQERFDVLTTTASLMLY
jgi:hypothetical protein